MTGKLKKNSPGCNCCGDECENDCESLSWSDTFTTEDVAWIVPPNWPVNWVSGEIRSLAPSPPFILTRTGYASRCQNLKYSAALDIEVEAEVYSLHGTDTRVGLLDQSLSPISNGGVYVKYMGVSQSAGLVFMDGATVPFALADETYYTLGIRVTADSVTYSVDGVPVLIEEGIGETSPIFGCGGWVGFRLHSWKAGAFARATSVDVTDHSGVSLYA